MRQVGQCWTPATASPSAARRKSAPSRSRSSRWKAMRWADFGPTPGRRRSASISRVSRGEYAVKSQAQVQSRRQVEAAGRRAQLLGRQRLDLLHRVVDRGGHQVLEEFLVFLERRRVDLHAMRLVLAAQRDLDHAGAGFAGDFGLGQLVLQPPHVLLHLLRLAHQVAEAHLPAFHWFAPLPLPPRAAGWTEPARTVAPNFSLSARTAGSPSIACSAARWRSASRCSSSRAGDLAPGASSICTRSAAPACFDSACSIAARRSSCNRCLTRWSSARRTVSPLRPSHSQLRASCLAKPSRPSASTRAAQSAPSGAAARAGPPPLAATGALPAAGRCPPAAPGRNASIRSSVISKPSRG